MTIKWIPPGPACPKCGGLNPKEVPCGSCDYKPGDPLFGKNELLTKEQFAERIAILRGLSYPIKRRWKKFL